VDLSLTETVVESQLVVAVRGEVDVHSAAQLRDQLISSLDSGNSSVIVDLSKLDFIDSTGLGALVAGRNHAAGISSSLRLVCSSERLLKLFRITGLDTVFDIYPTLPAATADGSSGATSAPAS
jgi:anti-sigma B factor antagonist